MSENVVNMKFSVGSRSWELGVPDHTEVRECIVHVDKEGDVNVRLMRDVAKVPGPDSDIPTLRQRVERLKRALLTVRQAAMYYEWDKPTDDNSLQYRMCKKVEDALEVERHYAEGRTPPSWLLK